MADKVLGIMSGTSCDGVDYALCSIDSKQMKLIKHWSVPYPVALRKRVLKVASNQATSYEAGQLQHDLGRFYADKAPKVRCDYVGLHGQTVYHNTQVKPWATWQIGEPSYLAIKFGVPVINQFRVKDLALGGQGAPLATFFHQRVFGEKSKTVAVNNLGGISNVTYLPAHGKVMSFDTGPANMLIDLAVTQLTKGKKTFDENGQMASQGIADFALVCKWLMHPFFKMRPPKSTGREDFGVNCFEKLFKECKKKKMKPADIVATFTAFTAQSLSYNYELFFKRSPEKVILCGGGAKNPELVKYIARALRSKTWVDVRTCMELGWPAEAIEAAAFALLAYQTKHSKPGHLPETTGARRACVIGQIVP